MLLTVVICTHNPRRDYLQRTLEGLRTQTLLQKDWELLLIDNRSMPALCDDVSLAWHTAGRILREEELGLTPSRLRGLADACAPLVLFVDDDNILSENYLEETLRISSEWPRLGAWGAGELTGEFEEQPPTWMEPFHWYFTVHQVANDRWSNQPDFDVFPPGAGLAVRKEATKNYIEILQTDPFRRTLDRRGTELSSCGDLDLLWCMTEAGWGVGRFTSLRLRHLIPTRRIEESYMEKLIANMWCSNVLLKYAHGKYLPGKRGMLARISLWRYERTLSARARWAHDAKERGMARADEIIRRLRNGETVQGESHL